jgi:hypothetical protein
MNELGSETRDWKGLAVTLRDYASRDFVHAGDWGDKPHVTVDITGLLELAADALDDAARILSPSRPRDTHQEKP